MVVVGRSRFRYVNDTPGTTIDSESSPTRTPYPTWTLDDGVICMSSPALPMVGTYDALTRASTPPTLVTPSGMPPKMPTAASAVGRPIHWSFVASEGFFTAPLVPCVNLPTSGSEPWNTFPRTPMEKWPNPPRVEPVPSVALPPARARPSCGAMNWYTSAACWQASCATFCELGIPPVDDPAGQIELT